MQQLVRDLKAIRYRSWDVQDKADTTCIEQ